MIFLLISVFGYTQQKETGHILSSGLGQLSASLAFMVTPDETMYLNQIPPGNPSAVVLFLLLQNSTRYQQALSFLL